MIYENNYAQEHKIKKGIETFIRNSIVDVNKTHGYTLSEIQIRISYLDPEGTIQYRMLLRSNLVSEQNFKYLLRDFYEKIRSKKVNLLKLKKVFLYLNVAVANTSQLPSIQSVVTDSILLRFSKSFIHYFINWRRIHARYFKKVKISASLPDD
jgi:hypothetical protein